MHPSTHPFIQFQVGILFIVDINECASNPCQYGGECVDGVDYFTCNCVPGFEGELCEISKFSESQIVQNNVLHQAWKG